MNPTLCLSLCQCCKY